VTEYIAAAGDTVDLIAWRVYGTREGRVVEQVLDANPGLAALGPELPAGARLVIPKIEPSAARVLARLWD
jgi:phage tail protein X